MSDFTFRLVFIGIYGHLLMRFSSLPSPEPVPKYGIQYLHPNYIVCHVSTQNLKILVSNWHLSYKIMAYNTQNALSRNKFGRKTQDLALPRPKIERQYCMQLFRLSWRRSGGQISARTAPRRQTI